MITPSFETLEMSSVLLSKNPERILKLKYPPISEAEEYVEFLELEKEYIEKFLESEVRTTISIGELRTTLKEELIRLLREREIVIKDEQLFNKLLEKLYPDEIELITRIVKKLIDENYSFHIEVYETEGDLEKLYFVIHYKSNLPSEEVKKDLFRLNEYVREINKNVLWFVGFASEIKYV